MICVPSTICPGMHIRHGQLSIIQISSVSDMHTNCSGMHIGHRQYLYNGQSSMSDMHTRADSTWYAYRTCTICIQINVYAYRLCPICTPEQVVRICQACDNNISLLRKGRAKSLF